MKEKLFKIKPGKTVYVSSDSDPFPTSFYLFIYLPTYLFIYF